MYSIRQEELFPFEDLFKMSSATKADFVLEQLPIEKILYAISPPRPRRRGRPEFVNTRAMIYSLILGKMEHIVFTKDLIRRLKDSPEFAIRCRFTGSDPIPSEASYSRLITKLLECRIFRTLMEDLADQATAEEFLLGDSLALDSAGVEAFDRNPSLNREQALKEENLPTETDEPSFLEEVETIPTEKAKPQKPKRSKRGRVPKAEEAAWQAELAAYHNSLSLFEREVADMLPCSYDELLADMPQYASTGAKGDPRRSGRMKYWYGYKLNIVVDCQSQYILTGETCSAHVSDQRPAIMLLKRIKERFPNLPVRHVLADKGYDSEPVYRAIRDLGAFPLIPLIHRSKESPEGKDKHLRPICRKGHSYLYDSYDSKRDTVKFTRPKECPTCPFQAEGCQKVFKFRVEENIRAYTAPGRGSKAFKQLFKLRTAVERVFAYLKLYLGLVSSRKLKKRAFVDMDLSCLTYNLCKLAIDRLNRSLRTTVKTI
ncbi:transposase [Paenibacillus sp. alder61]|uniref:transposase n=1 Tax=Paenibacillus sp. alder61 TaxID=2862948 RepID=UPI001CD20A94|nr:transposase [Paenibacillus sp. alder61]MCA1296696.1 transposase [Paenibacillus sp. alder61]